MRYDRLRNYCHRVSDGLQNDYYQIPLSVFDPEPNHLLFYCDFLEPASILLPVISTEHTATPEAISETTLTASQETPIQLGQWIQGRVDSFKLSTADFESINLTEDSQVYLFLIKRVMVLRYLVWFDRGA